MSAPLLDHALPGAAPAAFTSTYNHLMRALRLLREHHIVHYDLKPDNILVEHASGLPVIIVNAAYSDDRFLRTIQSIEQRAVGRCEEFEKRD